MKKVVRILGLCALAAFAFTSCNKEKETELTFKATITQPTDGAKTHIGDGNMLVWDEGNTIKVFNANGAVGDFTTSDSNVEEATFSGTLPQTSTYTAFYPNATVEESAVKLVLPSEQTYVESNFANNLYPMAAAGVLNNDIVNFPFHSPASVLRLVLKSDNNCTVKSITVTGGTNDKLVGDITYASYSDPTTCTFSNCSNIVTLNYANGKQLAANEETAFNIVVLSGSMSAGTKFEVKDMNGNIIKTLTTSRPNTLTAEHILVMPVVEISYALPYVITTAATGVTYEVATINGTYTFPAGAAVTACGFYWGTDQAAVENGTATKVNAAVGSPMSYNLTGLTANTTYYFKAWATNATGESAGAVLNFTTEPEPIVVVNPEVQTVGFVITGTAATLQGKLVNDGNEACRVGFYYGTDPTLNSHSTKNISGTHNTGYEYTWSWGGLSYNTNYYFRAFATNSTGTVMGDILVIRIDFQGRFLVDVAEHRFVNFSSGLLWWDNNAGTFAFEDTQSSFHRWQDNCDDINGSTNASFGQFCWSNEHNNFGKTNLPNNSGEGFVDWGLNSIRKSNSDEMYPAKYWRTLSFAEWQCIVENHNWITRDDMFVLLPYGVSTSTGNSSSMQQLSDMGAAFFPMSGNAVQPYPTGDNSSWGCGTQICVWTSTQAAVYETTDPYNSAKAVWLYPGAPGPLDPEAVNAYYHRMQVRLVRTEGRPENEPELKDDGTPNY